MKKVILILLLMITILPFNSNASGNEQDINKFNWKKFGWATTGIVSLVAILPAIRSDLNPQPGAYHREVPYCIYPMCLFLLSCLKFGEQCEDQSLPEMMDVHIIRGEYGDTGPTGHREH